MVMVDAASQLQVERSRRTLVRRRSLPLVRTVCCERCKVQLHLFTTSVSAAAACWKSNLVLTASGYGIVIPPTHATIKKVHNIPNELAEEVTKLCEERGVSNFFLRPKNQPRQKSGQEQIDATCPSTRVQCFEFARQAGPLGLRCRNRKKQTLTWNIAKCSSHNSFLGPECLRVRSLHANSTVPGADGTLLHAHLVLSIVRVLDR